MIDVRVDCRTEHWDCGDGCCSDWTDYYTVFFDGEEVLSEFEAYREEDAIAVAMKQEGIFKYDNWEFILVSSGDMYKSLKGETDG